MTALTATLEQAAHRATVHGGAAATQASGVSMRAGQRLTALVDAAAARARIAIADSGTGAGPGSASPIRRLYEGSVHRLSRILHDGAVARLALADMPPWARHGLMAPTMAMVLAATLATSSGVLLMSWHPAAPAAPAAPAVNSIPPAAPVELGPAITLGSGRKPVGIAPSGQSRQGFRRPRGVGPRVVSCLAPPSGRTARTVNATHVKALWGKTDTRSLNRALAQIRSATLAFQRCNLQMTSADAAVAHCDEARASDGQSSSRPRPVAWTIDFRRDDARWLIERISTSTTASNR